jgi:iron(III) transport system substrate-binding protein
VNKKLISLLSCVLLSAVIFSACGSNANTNLKDTVATVTTNIVENKSENNKEKEGNNQITLYISGPQKMVDELEETFEKDRGDVIKVYHNGCGPIRQKIFSEMEAGDIEADVVWAAEPLMYMDLMEKGKLTKYMSPEVENLKEDYKNIANGYYTPVNARYGVIIYNKDSVTKENIPHKFNDLTKPCFKNLIAIADLRQSSTALALTSGIYQIFDYKWDYFKELNENNIMLTKQNVAAVEKVDSGEFNACIAPHDAALRLIKLSKKKGVNSSLAIAWPEEGAISIQRPIGIIEKSSRNEQETKIAKEFVDFALSETAQNISTKYGFITVRKDLSLPKGVPTEVKSVTVDWKYANENEDNIREGYNEIFSAR